MGSPHQTSVTVNMATKLAIPAVRQIISKLAKGEKEEEDLVEKIENSCLKFDHAKKEVKNICGPLPCSKDGKIKIRDFLYLDIHSESAFRAMDRNKDGYITKGELKLAKKKMSMKEVDQVIKEYDIDQDGKLNYEEFLKSKK